MRRSITAGTWSAAVGLALLSALAPATPAGAAPQDLDTLTCTGTSTTTYNPPITAVPATTTRTIHQTYGPCAGTGAAAAVTGGTHDSSNTTSRSCLQLLSTATVSWVIHWSNGQSSTVTAQRVSNLAGAVFTNTFTGTVTSGFLKDRGFVETMTSPSLQITACTLGLGSVSGLGAAHTFTLL
ncbi:hypothetical protein [Streptomyces sp. WAC08241]|uniref:hypothetical protein n=1 Tax=Streptomyces sp. WAC08241 TaxID=2487421 RepID=UPI000F76A2AF|nr:hypothetical protein [Streptomyces sp. WAC08241]RSS38370.1 hypothetical protein EF906_21100 [Streptomyces sp. WAC08241]